MLCYLHPGHLVVLCQCLQLQAHHSRCGSQLVLPSVATANHQSGWPGQLWNLVHQHDSAISRCKASAHAPFEKGQRALLTLRRCSGVEPSLQPNVACLTLILYANAAMDELCR